MKEVILDGNEMTDKKEIHPYLKSKLNITGYYGNNLDSLWDVLSTISVPLQVHLIHSEQLLDYLGDYGTKLVGLFHDADQQNSNIDFIVHEKD